MLFADSTLPDHYERRGNSWILWCHQIWSTFADGAILLVSLNK